MVKNKHKGSTVESFLEEEGLLDASDAVAIKRVIALELKKNMKKYHCSKIEMANKMQTSRSALDRLLDPSNTSVTLNTLLKAAHFLGRRLCITLR